MKAKAARGEIVRIISGGDEFVFQAVRPKTWQGALKGKARVKGEIFSTEVDWEASR